MVIKSKKWKTIVSFAAFVLGVSLLLQSTVTLGYRVWSAGGIGEITQDYQESERFRSFMRGRLANFLALATGGSIGYYEGAYGGDYYGAVSYVEDEITEGIALEEVEETGTQRIGDSVEAIEGNTAEYMEEPLPWEETQKQREQRNQQFLQNIKPDKNLLYRISYDGEELYSNMQDVEWDEPGEELPEGYDYLLYFDGEKVNVVKDGVELDIYGDGFYREDEDWYVPGYKNFTVDEDVKKVRIVMLAAETPVLYTTVKYGEESGYYMAENGLYYIAGEVSGNYRAVWLSIAGMIAGILFFALYLLWRSEKRRGDQILGRVTGKIWFEVKAAALGIAAVVVFFHWKNDYWYGDIITEITYAMSYDYGMESWMVRELVNEFLCFAGARAGEMTMIFWLLYLLGNDIRQNRRQVLNGLIRRFAEQFERRNLKLEFSRRMVRRFSLVFLMSLFLIVLEFILILPNGELERLLVQYPAVVVIPLILVFLAFLGVCYYYISGTKRQAQELDVLASQIQAIHDGNYMGTESLPEGSELREVSENLAKIRQGMENAIEERMKSERMKVELVANVSHDIKTPLTSIISYVQFLKQEEDLPEHVKDYIRILDEKSQRLNNMVQDVFAVSKAASGQLPVKMETLDFGKLLRQTLADMEEQILKSPVTLKAEIPEHEIFIEADGGRMYRVFQNLIQNALKYSLADSRVYVTLKEDASVALASIKNISSQELCGDRDFTERFVRGDESRTDGGSGLGLSIAKSFTEACGGKFKVETIADLFVVTVSFSKNRKSESCR